MQNPRSDSNYQGENDNCEALAPFVMSLFDGQADEFEAKRARAHLLVCQTCAHRWLDWNRSRDLMRSVPVPAPPPTQLWRVLMACRLAAFSQQGSKAKVKSGTNFNGAPTDLGAQILARTTRSAATVPAVSTSRKWRGLGMPAMAVPVMAMWLLVLQRDPFLALVSSEQPNRIENEITAPPVTTPRAMLRSVAAPRPHNAPEKVVALPVRAMKTEPAEEVAEPKVAPPVERREAPVREIAWGRSDEATELAPVRLASTSSVGLTIPRTREEKPEVREVADPVERAVPAVRPVPMPQPVKLALNTPARPRIARVVLRPASLSDDENRPSLRTAHWKRVSPTASPASPVVISSPAQVLRVSLPSAPAPAPTPLRLLAENFEGDDGHVDEMRSVVDDFRETLSPDTSTATETDEDLSSS